MVFPLGGRAANQVGIRIQPVAALAATTTVAYGVLFYAYAVLLGPMQSGLGWSRTFLSGVFSLALVLAAALTIPIGHWLDRHRPRGLFLAAASAAGVLVIGWGTTNSRPLFVLIWLLLGCCQAVLFYNPAFTVLTKWYDGRDRTRAITTVTLVAGLASTIFAPLTGLLDHNLGWRAAVIVLAIILVGISLPCFALGLRSAPNPPERSRAHAPEHHHRSEFRQGSHLPSEALRSRRFWLLTLAYLLSAMTTFAVAVHLVSYLRTRGLGTGAAATVLGGVGLLQVLGRGTFVRLSARRTSVHLATWVLGAKGAGLALLLVFPGLLGIGLFLVVYGAANGVATLTQALTVGDLFGPDHYGAISSVIASVSAVGGATAPFIAAAMIGVVGGIRPVFAGLVGLSVLAALANELVARASRESRSRVAFAQEDGELGFEDSV